MKRAFANLYVLRKEEEGTRLNSQGEARQTRSGRNWGTMNFKAMKNEWSPPAEDKRRFCGSIENTENHRFTMKNLLDIFFHDYRSIFVEIKKKKKRKNEKGNVRNKNKNHFSNVIFFLHDFIFSEIQITIIIISI